MEMYNLVSLARIFELMLVAWLFSNNRRIVNWRLIFRAVLLQMLFALVIFRMPIGIVLFNWANSAVISVLSFAKERMYFLFGPLAVSPGEISPAGERSIGFILAFQILPTIIFFSALMALLYYTLNCQRIFPGFYQADEDKRGRIALRISLRWPFSLAASAL